MPCFILIENLSDENGPLFTVAVILDELRLEDVEGGCDTDNYQSAREIAEFYQRALNLPIRDSKKDLLA